MNPAIGMEPSATGTATEASGGTARDIRDIEVLRSFAILNRAFLSSFSASIADLGISYSEGIILANVGNAPGISQDGLARELVIDKAAVARTVKSLSGKGHLRLARSERDWRANCVSLTASGKCLFRAIEGLNRAWLDGTLAEIPAEEARTCLRAVVKMAERARTRADTRP